MSEDEKKNACPTDEIHEDMGNTIQEAAKILEVDQGLYGGLIFDWLWRIISWR